MNHPKLDICKIMGAEFKDSEFVHASRWTPYGTTRKVIVRSILEFDEKNNQFYVEGTPIDWKIEAPAPTCEELGEWLHSRGFSLTISWLGAGQWQLFKTGSMIAIFDGDMNETQARAEAVKMILPNKGKK